MGLAVLPISRGCGSEMPPRAGQATVGPPSHSRSLVSCSCPSEEGGYLLQPFVGLQSQVLGPLTSLPLRGLIWSGPCVRSAWGQGRGSSGRATESPQQDVLRPELSEDGKDEARQ